MAFLRNLLKSFHKDKGLIFIAFGNLFGATLTGILWLYLATFQDPQEYGQINYIISVSSLGSFVALLGLNTTVTSFVKDFGNISIQANQLALFSSITVAIIASILLYWLVGLFILSMTFWMMSSYELLGNKLYKQYVLVVVGARSLQLFLATPLYITFGNEGVIFCFIVSFFAFSYRYFRSIRFFSFKFYDLKGKITFSLHAYSFNMSTAFLLYFDKLVIAPLFGYALLGYYQISLQFLLFIGMIPISLYQYLLSAETISKERKSLRILAIGISIFLAFSLFILSPWLITKLFPNFIDSIDALRVTSIGIIPMTFIWTINSRLFKLEKSKIVAIGSAIYVSAQVVLLFLLGNLLGILGLAIALVVSLTVHAIFLVISQRKVNKQMRLQSS